MSSPGLITLKRHLDYDLAHWSFQLVRTKNIYFSGSFWYQIFHTKFTPVRFFSMRYEKHWINATCFCLTRSQFIGEYKQMHWRHKDPPGQQKKDRKLQPKRQVAVSVWTQRLSVVPPEKAKASPLWQTCVNTDRGLSPSAAGHFMSHKHWRTCWLY